MTHDPLQSILGGYPGVTGQFGFPQTAQGGFSPFTQGYGIPPYQSSPYQNPILQNPLLQNPLLTGMQNPGLQQQLQHPLVQQLQHALAQQHLQQNPFGNPVQAQIQAQVYAQLLAQQIAAQQLAGQPYGGHMQVGTPFGQTGQFGPGGVAWGQGGYPLAPQTWVGQGSQFGGYGQIHPLAYLAGRGQQTPGINPWAGI